MISIQKAIKFLLILTLLSGISLLTTKDAYAMSTGNKLTIYYGIPYQVNGANSIDGAAKVFEHYDIVVFGEGLEESSNTDHEQTKAIISKIHADNPNEKIFGYIDLGVGSISSSTRNWSSSTLHAKIDKWFKMGADGIFLDDAGYDFYTDRSRLNATLDYIHSKNVFHHTAMTIVNAWNPDDVMGNGKNKTLNRNGFMLNPNGTPSHMGLNDFYLLENWVIDLGEGESSYASNYGYNSLSDSSSSLSQKANKAVSYRHSLGVKLLANSTLDYSSYNSSQINTYFKMLETASAIYSLDAYGINASNESASGNNINQVRAFDYNPNYFSYYSSRPIVNLKPNEISRSKFVFHDAKNSYFYKQPYNYHWTFSFFLSFCSLTIL